MTAFLVIVIIVLAVKCGLMWLAIQDYKLDLKVTEKAWDRSKDAVTRYYQIQYRRGQLLKDISEALPKEVSSNAKELYKGLWKEIQEDIQKELKARL